MNIPSFGSLKFFCKDNNYAFSIPYENKDAGIFFAIGTDNRPFSSIYEDFKVAAEMVETEKKQIDFLVAKKIAEIANWKVHFNLSF